MKLFSNGSIFDYVGTVRGARTITIIFLVAVLFLYIIKKYNINTFGLLKVIGNKIFSLIEKVIHKKELRYHRDIEVGKIDKASIDNASWTSLLFTRNSVQTISNIQRVKVYRFLNDLIIDLGLKQKGATPYEFLFLVMAGSILASIIICEMVFGSAWMAIVLFPIVLAANMCMIYTHANIEHDARIEAVLESENIICNNIKSGVVVAVRNCIDILPKQVRQEYKDFLDNVDLKNYHIKTALQELNLALGSVSDEFIKKCIVFELEEETGIAGMFNDVVEINNIKMEMRVKMKRKFEDVKNNFIIGALMIFIFLGGVIAIYKDIAHFYFKLPIGQLILAFDALIVIGEFVYITYLRAKEL